ncbi:hypothetical protein JXR93_11535 [bacterium]|nr:hypothetical protein [bacterium]
MSRIWLALSIFVVIFASGCADTEKITDVCRDVVCGNGNCVDNSGSPKCDCNTGYHAEGLVCVTNATNPCQGVTCSGHGVCVVQNSAAVCSCNEGYVADGLNCAPDTQNVCTGVTCSGHGNCVEVSGAAQCSCEDGYRPEGINCIQIVVDPCANVTCSGHGTCSVLNGKASCSCETGYQAYDLSCIPESVDLCEGITCSNHGDCGVVSGSPKCVCDSGYIAVGFECKAETNPCQGVTCSGNGICAVANNEAICVCDEGYTASGLNCVNDTNPCRGITCSGYGVCEVQGTQAVCNCQDGYVAQGLSCIQNLTYSVEWCNLQSPASINSTINEPTTVYGQVFIRNLTDTTTTANSNVKAQLGYSTSPIVNQGTPIDSLTWVNASFNIQSFDNHEYKADFNVATVGTYYYIYRFSADNGTTWKYCGLRGVFTNDSGVASVVSDSSPCDGVDCGGHGTCSVVNNAPLCSCENGYTLENNTCVSDTTEVEWCAVWSPKSIVGEVGTTRTIYGQLFVPGVTTENTPSTQIKAQMGFNMGQEFVYPFNPEWFVWKDAQFNVKFGNNHEYKVDMNFEVAGTYNYIYRFSADGGNTWKFCGTETIISESNRNVGHANIFGPCDGVTCSDHGVCMVENGEAYCDCEFGYQAADGLQCVEELGIEWCGIKYPATINSELNGTPVPVYGQLFIDGVTTQSQEQPFIKAQLGIVNTPVYQPLNPSNLTWIDASFNIKDGNNHEYTANFPTTTEGTYSYLYRFSMNGGETWRYCDTRGVISDGVIYSGVGNVTAPNDPCSGVDCGGHGVCQVSNSVATCSCNSGYNNSENSLVCVENAAATVEWCNIQYPTEINVSINTSKTVFGQVLVPSITDSQATESTQLKGQLGYSTTPITDVTTDPITWKDATFNTKVGNNHEYKTAWLLDTAGRYYYIYRFSADNGTTWRYCDKNGVVAETVASGVATVSGYTVSWCKIQSPLQYDADEGDSRFIFGQVYVDGVTDTLETASPSIKSEFAYTIDRIRTLQSLTTLQWNSATFNVKYFSNHEYRYTLYLPEAGNYSYVYRFSADGGNSWTYCDRDGVVTETAEVTAGSANIHAAYNPCDGVTCSSHGSCVVEDLSAVCNCDTGYVADGLNCIEEVVNPCEGVTCSGHGSCANNNGVAVCNCDSGYSAQELTCVEDAAPVVEWCKLMGPVTISGEQNSSPERVYAQVFIPTVTTNSGPNAQIKGELGFATTVATPINPTQLTWVSGTYNASCSNCGNNHEYMADFPTTTAGEFKYIYRFSANGGTTWSYCDKNGVIANSVSGGDATITAIANPCEDVTCSNHGSCVVEDLSAVCNCDTGYVADGLNCIEEVVDPCADGSCTFHSIVMDGQATEWKLTEYLGDGGAGISSNITWDSENIYIALKGKDFSSDSSARFEIYIDSWSGQGTNDGLGYALDHDGGVNARVLPTNFKADYVLEVSDTVSNYYSVNSATNWWQPETFSGEKAHQNYLQVPNMEIKIPFTNINTSSRVQIYMFVTNSSNDYVYSVWPVSNVQGEDNSVASEDDSFYRFSLTSGQKPNDEANIVQ